MPAGHVHPGLLEQASPAIRAVGLAAGGSLYDSRGNRHVMVDRVYKSAIPEYRRILQALRKDFKKLGSKTDWASLRVEPVLRHAASLERILHSGTFSRETARLNKGVVLFHSDLVYLRTNVKALRELLAKEKKRLQTR